MSASLGFATDLALRAMEGSTVERSADAVVVRTPANPGFRWGNFLLTASVEEEPEHWAARHRVVFPDAGFVTVGIDDANAVLDGRAWRAAGFEVERLVVLEARAVDAPCTPCAPAVRSLVSEEDWAALVAIEADEAGGIEDPVYGERRTRQRRTMVDGGRAVWLGAEVDGSVVATLGVADAGDGVARFQDVQTLRAFRRRGLAAALVTAGAREAVRYFGSTRLVIVAEADGDAVRLYRRLGFRAIETQVQLSRLDGDAPPRGPVGGAP